MPSNGRPLEEEEEDNYKQYIHTELTYVIKTRKCVYCTA
jgi:hypothetical protein